MNLIAQLKRQARKAAKRKAAPVDLFAIMRHPERYPAKKGDPKVERLIENIDTHVARKKRAAGVELVKVSPGIRAWGWRGAADILGQHGYELNVTRNAGGMATGATVRRPGSSAWQRLGSLESVWRFVETLPAIVATEAQARGNPGKVDEALWTRAKRIVKPDWDRYDQPWAVVQKVYKNLGGR